MGRVITVIIVIAIIASAVFLRFRQRVHRYDDPSTTGNTSMNLLNGGLFATAGDSIYFANPYDDNSLYSMDMNFGHVKKIYNDYASYINAAGDYIFYTRRNDKKGNKGNALLSLSNTGLYRIKTNGNGLDQLYREPTQVLNLFGNSIYYQHYDEKQGLQLYKIDIDGKNDTMLLDEGVSPTVIVDDMIYYTGYDEDHNIHALSINGGSASVICQGNFTNLSYSNGKLYCMDMENNYTLCSLELDGSNLTHLTQERIATYNVSQDGETIYYQIDNGTDNGLYAMDSESGSQVLLSAGNYNYLHIIKDYLFFEEYDGSVAYVMDTATEEIKEFHPDK